MHALLKPAFTSTWVLEGQGVTVWNEVRVGVGLGLGWGLGLELGVGLGLGLGPRAAARRGVGSTRR